MGQIMERKLAAIMFTDIAGYTLQMSKDQDFALSILDTKRKALKPLIKKHKGTLVKEMGDGTLSHFPSAIDATNCSLDLQKSLKDNNDLNIRIGVHLGDTSFRDKDVFGDGVNIASRLEKMSPPGGILVSKNVYDELTSRKGYDAVSIGLQSMKGVGRLVEVFGLKDEYLKLPIPSDYTNTKVNTHKDKEVPSIAIIPFKNKGEKEDEFYAYSISVDLISKVTKTDLIKVVSKKQIDEVVKLNQSDLVKKLDVRYIANGELWRMGDIFQLSIELYDSKDKKVVWSDNWEEKWENLPIIKDSLSEGLFKVLNIKLKNKQKIVSINPEAYEFYLKAKYKYEKRKNTDDTEIVRGLLNKAIALDNNFILAKNMLGNTYIDMGEYDKAMKIYISGLNKAKELDDKQGIAVSLNSIGNIYNDQGVYNKALECYDKAFAAFKLLDNKNGMADIFTNAGLIYYEKGNYKKALVYQNKALAIYKDVNYKPGIQLVLSNSGLIYGHIGEYDKALDSYETSIKISKEINDKQGESIVLHNTGNIYHDKGQYNKVLSYYKKSLAIDIKLGDKYGIAYTLNNIGILYFDKGKYNKGKKYFNNSLTIQKEIGISHNLLLTSNIYLLLSNKYLKKDYNTNKIHRYIKEIENIEFEENLQLYKLLEDNSYLKAAYRKLQDKALTMKEKIKKKFFAYPIPKEIIEEYNKVFK